MIVIDGRRLHKVHAPNSGFIGMTASNENEEQVA